MKLLNSVVCILLITSLFSCATGMRASYPEPEIDETLKVEYPQYRIDARIKKIAILGIGEGSGEITEAIASLLHRDSNIKVVELGTLEFVMRDKFKEYGTEFTSVELQNIARTLQIDHILLFEEKLSPLKDYMVGGKADEEISLKIIDTLNGEVIFQAMSIFGITFKDPRPYGYGYFRPLTQQNINFLRNISYIAIAFQLNYALGKVSTGIIPDTANDTLIGMIFLDSPADKAGLQKGDKILEINGTKTSKWSDIRDYFTTIKQGESIKIKIEREEEPFELELTFPIIPLTQKTKEPAPPIQEEKTPKLDN